MSGFHFQLSRFDLLPWTLLAFAALVPLMAWLYRGHATTRPWYVLLLLLRAGAMAGLLIAVVRLSAVRRETPSEGGPVLLLVDTSASMNVSDVPTAISARVALADALGMTRGLVRADPDTALRQPAIALAAHLEAVVYAQSEFDYARVSGRDTAAAEERIATALAGVDAETSRLTAASQAILPTVTLGEECAKLSAAARQRQGDWLRVTRAAMDRINEMLDRVQAGADETAYRDQPPVRMAVDALGSLSRRDVSWLAAERIKVTIDPKRSTKILEFGATVTGEAKTDILNSLDAAMRQMPKPSAVVVLTDGRQTTGELRTATEVLPTGIPVFSVVCGQSGRRDVVVASLTMPNSTFVNEFFDVVVQVTCPNSQSERLGIAVRCNGRRFSQTVTPRDGRAQATFTIASNRAGLLDVVGEVMPGPQDMLTANNSMVRHIKVFGEPLRIAMISTGASTERESIRDSLQSKAWLKVSEEMIPPGEKWAMSADEILRQGVLIFSDVSAAAISETQRTAVRTLVMRRGGSVIITAGTVAAAMDIPEWAEMVPWIAAPQWRTWTGSDVAFRVQPPSGTVARHPFMLDVEPSVDRQRWNEMPSLSRIAVSRSMKSKAATLLSDRNSGDPVVTEMSAGLGRVLYVGTNETRRWRSSGAGVQERLWSQLVRYSAEPGYAASRDGLALDANPLELRPGDAVSVRARMDSAFSSTKPVLPIELTLTTPDGVTRKLPVPAMDAAMGGRFDSTFANLPAGRSVLRLSSGSASLELPIDAQVDFESELRDISLDEGYARRFAELTGGEMIRVDDLASLPRRISTALERQPRLVVYPIWSSVYLFLFIVGCLSAEWAIRKQSGMV